MEIRQLLIDVMTPYWWVSVFVVGIIVNLVSAYLKPFIDSLRARWSKKREENLNKKSLEREQMSDALASESTMLLLECERLASDERKLIFLSVQALWVILPAAFFIKSSNIAGWISVLLFLGMVVCFALMSSLTDLTNEKSLIIRKAIHKYRARISSST